MVEWTSYGAAAYDRLRAEVADLKSDDLLAHVTVLVPTNLCGVIARRALAGGIGGRAGIVGLQVLTVDRLAERLAAPALIGSGRRPATGPILAAAWKRVLDADPGAFASVAAHPATVRALVDAHRQLRDVESDALDAIAANGESIAADVVRLHRQVVRILSPDWYDVADLRRTGTAVLRDNQPVRQEIGAVVVFMPQDLPSSATELLAVLSEADDMHVIAAITRDQRADAGVIRAVGAISDRDDMHGPHSTVIDAGQPPRATRVLHASDADDEVRCVVREVVAALSEAPAHRVAVLYGRAEPYARLLAEHLGAAGITWNGTSARPTIERTLARVMPDLLALPDHDWRREEVLALLAIAPVKDAEGARVPASRWERISRAAGVVAGDDWDHRLSRFAADERAYADHAALEESPREGLIARHQRDADAADDLRSFVARLRDILEAGALLGRWRDLTQWSQDTYRALVGDIDEEPWLPEDETRAAEKVTRTLAGLAGLDAVGAAADLTALRLTLELELADDLARQGKFGEGVLVAPLSAAIGLDADVTFVVGLAEDLVPGAAHADALLTDHVRKLTHGQLPPLRDRVDRRHRHLLAAFASAPQCLASFPRGDLRKSSERLPSRWLLPTLQALSGDPTLEATRWQTAQGNFVAGSPSYAASLLRSPTLASEQEWRTRAAAFEATSGEDIRRALPNDRVIARAVAMQVAHASGLVTRFDGDLSGVAGLPDPYQSVVSPTAMEAWSICPHAYFVQRMLHVEPVIRPEAIVYTSALEIGNLIHAALDEFFTAQLRAGAVPAGATAWTSAQRLALRQAALDAADRLVERGVAGHRLLWRQELNRILVDLDGLLDDDERLRAQTGRRQRSSELVFGGRGIAPVQVALPDGRALWFRGSADRVDMAGDAIVVVDYKSGRPQAFNKLNAADPTARGTKLQLPVYAYAARAAFELPAAAVSAEYWFVRRERGKRVQVPLTDDVAARFAETLVVIADGILGGLFPHRPPREDPHSGFVECRYCDPDGYGVSDLRRRWAAKRADPRLADYRSLVGDTP